MSPFPEQHNTMGYYMDNRANIFPAHIRTQNYNKSERDILNDTKGISLHELTHGSQDKAGAMESTSDDYYQKFLKNIMDEPLKYGASKDDYHKLVDIDAELGDWGLNRGNGTFLPTDIANNQHKSLDFLSYWFHPLEREARASEDMLLRSLDDRAKDYLKGVDSEVNLEPYKSAPRLIDMLHKLFVTGELHAPQVMRVPKP
jgi:hypothetical protein